MDWLTPRMVEVQTALEADSVPVDLCRLVLAGSGNNEGIGGYWSVKPGSLLDFQSYFERRRNITADKINSTDWFSVATNVDLVFVTLD